MDWSPLLKKIAGPIIAGVAGYFGLKQYGKTIIHRVTGKPTNQYSSDRDFWRDVLGSRYYDPQHSMTSKVKLKGGELIRLTDFQLIEWFPRCPGLYWTKKATESRVASRNDIQLLNNETVLSPKGKGQMILGGRGTTRLPAMKLEDNRFKILCATKSPLAEQGIPVILTENVYSKVVDQINESGSVMTDLEGFLFNNPIDWSSTVISSLGNETLSQGLRNYLSTTLHVPKYCIVVGSRLMISKKESKTESNIRATAWTLFQQWSDDYSYTFSTFSPKDEDTIVLSSDFIKDYVEQFNGIRMITDFDGVIARLPHVDFPISKKIEESDKQLKEDYDCELKKMVRWTESYEDFTWRL